MSEESREHKVEESLEQTEALTAELVDDGEPEVYEVTVNKNTNELIIKDSKAGQVIATLPLKVEDEEPKPLAPDDFRKALERVDKLGLTWTADRVPHVKPKDESISDEVFLSEEYDKIRQDYPALPLELSSIVFHLLTGNQPLAKIVGGQDDLEKKSAIAEEFFITPAYKAEFFFKHAIKVPYLKDIDWEVVLKLAERNVDKPPHVPYALLSLKFEDPNRSSREREHQTTHTVAVDKSRVDELMRILGEVRDSLEKAGEIKVDGRTVQEEKDNADGTGQKPEKLE